jgi:hypothetical protein
MDKRQDLGIQYQNIKREPAGLIAMANPEILTLTNIEL